MAVVYTLTRGTQVTDQHQVYHRQYNYRHTCPVYSVLYRERDILSIELSFTEGLFHSYALLRKVKLCAFSSKNWFSLKFDLSLNEWYGIKMTTKDRCAFVKPICTNEHKISCFLHDAIYFSLSEHSCRTDRE